MNILPEEEENEENQEVDGWIGLRDSLFFSSSSPGPYFSLFPFFSSACSASFLHHSFIPLLPTPLLFPSNHTLAFHSVFFFPATNRRQTTDQQTRQQQIKKKECDIKYHSIMSLDAGATITQGDQLPAAQTQPQDQSPPTSSTEADQQQQKQPHRK
jgi:hypothetical protein